MHPPFPPTPQNEGNATANSLETPAFQIAMIYDDVLDRRLHGVLW